MYWLVALVAITSAITLSATLLPGKAQQKPRTLKVLRQQDAARTGQQPTEKELDDASAPIVDLAAAKNKPVDEKRRKKSKKFDHIQDGRIEDTSPSGDFNLVSEGLVSDMPVEMSDLIVEGDVKDANAFLSDDGTGVYSEFTISVSDVIKSSAPVQKHDEIAAERFGGRVRFPSGQLVRYKVVGHGSPSKGGKYIFFLKQMGDGDYRILTAYEMRGNKIVALDGARTYGAGRGDSPYDKHTGKDAQEFKKEVIAAVRGGGR
ncbi:MAG: hypothetical protein JOZ96_11760 [Acidobacteria bacterium]|nr:hypothetical protein [Acidobacteriota bacterium]